jgi:hypothetical protein
MDIERDPQKKPEQDHDLDRQIHCIAAEDNPGSGRLRLLPRDEEGAEFTS